jgi:transposase
MEGRQRRSFTDDYKRQAVDLAASSGRSIGSVARELDLRDSVLRRWVERRGAGREPTARRPTSRRRCRRRTTVRRENDSAREEELAADQAIAACGGDDRER